jgi:hypothetical protein
LVRDFHEPFFQGCDMIRAVVPISLVLTLCVSLLVQPVAGQPVAKDGASPALTGVGPATKLLKQPPRLKVGTTGTSNDSVRPVGPKAQLPKRIQRPGVDDDSVRPAPGIPK